MRIIKIFTPVILIIFIFFVFLHNLSQSVYGGDVGDLVTAAFVGGVAHPPGYPLFTLLGFFLARFPFFPTPAFAVGMISVLAGALGIFFFYQTSKLIIKNTYISVIVSLTLAFSYFYWLYSEMAEVFILNTFFQILLLYLAIKITTKKTSSLVPLVFFIAGLSLTNHQTIILIFPSLFILSVPLLLDAIRRKVISTRLIFLSLSAFIIGLCVYAYVFIASAHNPVVNWDTVHDIPSFLYLFLRKDYGTFSAGIFAIPSLSQRLVIIKTYLVQILTQLTIPVIVIALVGFLYALKKQKLLAISLLLGFLISGPLFIGYAGFPLTGNFYFGVNERFFLLSTIFIFYFFAFGLSYLVAIFKKLSHVPVELFLAVFLVVPGMLFFYNFPKTDLSHVFIGDTYAKDLLISLPKNAIVFLGGDTIIFNVWYAHYVLGIRPDVRVLNINGNVGSPYFSILEKNYFRMHPHTTKSEIQKGILAGLPKDGSVFSVDGFKVPGGSWIPYGLTLQLVDSSHIPSHTAYTAEQEYIWSHMHIPIFSNKSLAEKNVTIADIPNSYANAMLLIGNYYLSRYKDNKEALKWYQQSRTVSPTYEKTYSSLGVYYLTIQQQCSAARDNFTKALALNPIDPLNYFLLYATYTGCLHDNYAANTVKARFEKQFQTSFTKALAKIKD